MGATVNTNAAQLQPSEAFRGDRPVGEQVGEDVECVRCGYILRGLTEPRCPECGLGFAWADLLDPLRRRHPYLFEHQAENGAVRAFVQTFGGALRPMRFWRTLALQQRCHPVRLGWFWLGMVVLYGGLMVLPYLAFYVAELASFGTRRAAPPGATDKLVLLLSAPLVVPLATLVALLVFQESLARWRVRSFHIFRCVIYGGVASLPAAMIASIIWSGWMVAHFFVNPVRWTSLGGLVLQFTALIAVPACLCWWMSLWCAYRRYLKIRRPLGMLVASQIVAGLAAIDFLAVVFPYATVRNLGWLF